MATPTAPKADPDLDQLRDRAVDTIAQVQEAGLRLAGSVAESWASALRGLPGIPGLSGGVPGLSGIPGLSGVPGLAQGADQGVAGLPRTPAEVVDRVYDTGVQILEAQRSVAHQVLDAVAPALPSARATVTSPLR
ncbi:hypothetical protein [Actinomycetospora straminea]|uniref:Excreted virulence factor EspC (Type VII ESX diderm) n=1 Tax=Actinomycetospora straminea TaxID=663607 RepID=A0ABP9E518_9PSEU|nr:hypothetical protein [Actinomycetospora straminea]MDD7932638.1 hypothetical protein [Actinomycetospora straminea]